MKLFSIPAEELSISEAELSLRLGVPRGYDVAAAERIRKKLLSVSECRGAAACLDVIETEKGVLLGDIEVASLDLKKCLSHSRRAYVLAVTLGMGVERYLLGLSKMGAAEHFLADSVASACAEALCDRVQELLLGDCRTPRFSPGYGDLSLEIQPKLLSLFSADKTLGITLTEKLLMRPQKSITAIVGIKNE